MGEGGSCSISVAKSACTASIYCQDITEQLMSQSNSVVAAELEFCTKFEIVLSILNLLASVKNLTGTGSVVKTVEDHTDTVSTTLNSQACLCSQGN